MKVIPEGMPWPLARTTAEDFLSTPVCDPTGRKLQYEVQIAGQKVMALLDTGATHSFVRHQLVKQWDLQMRPRARMAVKFFNRTATVVEHEVELSLMIECQERRWTFLVLSDAEDPLVVGLDLVRAWKMVVDPINLRLYMPKDPGTIWEVPGMEMGITQMLSVNAAIGGIPQGKGRGHG